ncbi:hypothetical protein RE428_32390 [Marinobacter nanhaiticus D15-8W]|uniref:Uncharacterized protein n=1 Tax=Marinobacter nanhaiticus D15-8W TaxID=626887 RepID=N6X715_9GAMM|nr:hypothetical protein [Marinobacter nanhaiticus]ENO16928.1 hypothetical protein J057_01950 [Marinobacter nanhaiticus D15-8W]BES72221.1 hypothetical protein RE428_32390 [Marinobacter nanhaiticus D15-8W]
MGDAAKKAEPNLSMMCETLKAIREAADKACDTAQEAGVTGAINWGDLGCVDARFCIDEEGNGSFDVLIEEAAPGSIDLMRHVSEALVDLKLAWPVEVRTEW